MIKKNLYVFEVVVKIKESQRVHVMAENPPTEDEMLQILKDEKFDDISDTETLEYNEVESMQLIFEENDFEDGDDYEVDCD